MSANGLSVVNMALKRSLTVPPYVESRIWRRDKIARLPPLWFGFDSEPGVPCGLNLLVLVLAPTRVLLQYHKFSSLHKNQHYKIQINLDARTLYNELLKALQCYVGIKQITLQLQVMVECNQRNLKA